MPRYTVAAIARPGMVAGNWPSIRYHAIKNKGKATVKIPSVIASGGLSSPMRLSHTSPSDCVVTPIINAIKPGKVPSYTLKPPPNTSTRPNTPNTMPATLLAVSASSLSHSIAPRLVINGDKPNNTAIMPELTNCADQ